MTIADRIHNLRKMKNISQEELADKLGVSRQAVSKWESEQSTPDMEKIIILSEYFEVTTDYLLKGIESDEREKESESEIDANIFTLIVTALNFIGILIACFVIYGEHNPISIVVGLFFFIFSGVIFGFGQIKSNKNVVAAKRKFWIANIWMLSLLPLSALYNTLLSLPLAPFPHRGDNLSAFIAFWIVYMVICSCVSYVQFKALNKGAK